MLAAGLDPTDAQALARQWGVNRQLSWKVAKVIQIHDPYMALQHLPGNEGLGIILKKAEQLGVEASVLAQVRRAADAFDQLIETHCGDRAVFDIMGSGQSPMEQARQQQENLRKQFFLGASSIWGAQSRVNYVSWFVSPSAQAGSEASHVDLVNIKAWIGFRRLRENLSWVMSRQMSRHDSGDQMSVPAEALDPRASASVPLLIDFCPDPMPEFTLREEGDRTTVSLAPGPVGNAGQISCLFGKVLRHMPHVRSEADQFSRFMCYLNVPSEVAIFDLFVHRSMAEMMPPSVTLSSQIEVHEPDAERSRLPLHEPLIELGVPSPAPLTLEVPRHAELMELVMTRMGWSSDEFIGFRLRMNYPPLPAALVMRYELPGG
ncbi:hypothetical protein [Pelomonas sp. KK5]|uniref:hypothetical protein n=1 Tax=Pelomonas sp. KK5 TaxID=1855730 RepID=UPI00097C76AA|nr:hypothetical protein [Pelomonas sp. KK5]